MSLPGGFKCPDCGSERTQVSAVPGLGKCAACGKTFALPDDLVELLYAETTEPEGEGVGEIDFGEIVPDSIECAIGWRTWGIKVGQRAPGEKPLMWSVTHSEAFWTPGQPMTAVCPRSTGRANGVARKGHEVPDEGCSCGLYSAKTLEHLLSMQYHRYNAEANGMYSVVGKVKLWGKVIEGSQGWRAQFGYPAELYLPYEAWELIDPLADAYGVPVMLMNFLGETLTKKKTKEA